MKYYVMLSLFFLSFCFVQSEEQKDKFIPSFEFKANDLELSRLAQPTQYFDKIGPRAGVMGLESGQFEAWVWPWKPLRNFELQFLLGTSTQPIYAKDIVRTISVTPEATTILYTYESFTVKEHIFIPRDEPGIILLLEVHTTTPLSIIPGFIPVMQPMWPAGIGGQYSYWDEGINGYIISEGQRRAIIVCGSPAGEQMAAPPAHMFADNPIQFKIQIKPGETAQKFVPIVIAGANPDTLTWKMNYDSVKATYTRLWKNAERYYQEDYDYYQNLRQSTLQISTQDKNMNLAFEWGKVALDNLMIKNPRLGYGMVAGFGLSGGGARPGFAWYFGGDAFINVLTLNSVGMYQQAKDALAFTQKWQRQDNYPIRKTSSNDPPKDIGKMAHELSQSDGLCDWWNDYRYGYNHADTTPWYLVAMADYIRTSGDIEFLRQSWKSVKQAYEWCLSKDSDGDGLMDLKGAGLGALEFGKLVGIYADVYTCGVFVQGVKEMKYMAELVGDTETATQADAQFKKAQPQLEKKFWLEKEGFYAYGATDKGEQVREKTPWSGVAMMFGLLDEERTAKSIEAFNSADMCTDWGVRTLSNKSELFDPTNYNYGAVWPFIGSFFNTAQFKHHYTLSAYQVLQSNIQHVFDHALGVVPEVFSGELNEKLGEGYHHQGFSTTGYMLPLVRGLLGLEVDGVGKKIIFSSHIPMEMGAKYFLINHIKNGKNDIDIHFVPLNEDHNGRTRFSVVSIGHDTISLLFSLPKEHGVEISKAILKRGATDIIDHDLEVKELSTTSVRSLSNQDQHLQYEFLLDKELTIHVEYERKYFVIFPDNPNEIGATNQSLKIISRKIEDGKIIITCEGRAGGMYHVKWGAPQSNMSYFQGTEFFQNKQVIIFPSDEKQQFIRKKIVVNLK